MVDELAQNRAEEQEEQGEQIDPPKEQGKINGRTGFINALDWFGRIEAVISFALLIAAAIGGIVGWIDNPEVVFYLAFYAFTGIMLAALLLMAIALRESLKGEYIIILTLLSIVALIVPILVWKLLIPMSDCSSFNFERDVQGWITGKDRLNRPLSKNLDISAKRFYAGRQSLGVEVNLRLDQPFLPQLVAPYRPGEQEFIVARIYLDQDAPYNVQGRFVLYNEVSGGEQISKTIVMGGMNAFLSPGEWTPIAWYLPEEAHSSKLGIQLSLKWPLEGARGMAVPEWEGSVYIDAVEVISLAEGLVATPVAAVTPGVDQTLEPTNTPSQTPVSSDTPTSSLTEVVTVTVGYTPTPSSSPTVTGGPTPTPVPTPTNTPRAKYTAPQLIEPDDKANFHDESLTFRWRLEGEQLGFNEFFAVRIWQDGISPQSLDWVKSEYEYVFDIAHLASGTYYWDVVVVHPIIEEPYWEIISDYSDPREFSVTNPEPTPDTPTPTYKPTNTPMPTPTPEPALLSAPIWEKPQDQSNWQGVVQFQWKWERELGEDERFSVRVWPDGEPGPGHSKTWKKKGEGTSWQTGDLSREGWYLCHVVVLRVWTGNQQDCENYEQEHQLCYEEISERSQTPKFYFVPAPPPTPTWTPPP